MKSVYAQLVDAVACAAQGDREGFVRALERCPAQAVFSHAARHKCVPLLLVAFGEFRVREQSLRPLLSLLKTYAATFTAGAAAIQQQLAEITQLFESRRIEHVLLKTAGRLHAGDPRARWSHISDIDILVRECDADAAAALLLEQGYRWQTDAASAEGYRRNHHHLAPLHAPNGGKTIELHVALAPPGTCTARSDWHAMERYTEVLAAGSPLTRTFDRRGRALHYLLHGIGLHRLADAAMLAHEMQADPALATLLLAVARNDRIQRIPMLAVVHLAARIAGITNECEPAVDRYLAWTVAREDLSPFYRDRTHFVDAWFSNGGALRGPATPLAMPAARDYAGRRLPVAERCRSIAGRAVAGLAAYYAVHR